MPINFTFTSMLPKRTHFTPGEEYCQLVNYFKVMDLPPPMAGFESD